LNSKEEMRKGAVV